MTELNKVSLASAIAEQAGIETAGPSQHEGDAATPPIKEDSNKATKAKSAGTKAKAKPKPLEMSQFGLTNEAQWLLTIPSRYEDYKTYTDDFNSLSQGTPALVRGTIKIKKLYDDRGKETTDPRFGVRLFAVIKNKFQQTLAISIPFGKPGFAWKGYEVDTEVILRGNPRVNQVRGGVEMVGAEVVKPGDLGKIHAVFPAIRGTKGERFAQKVNAYRHLVDAAAGILATETGWNERGLNLTLSEVTQFDTPRQLLEQLLWPDSVSSGALAQRAAKFLCAWTLVRQTHLRTSTIKADPKSVIDIDMDFVAELVGKMPFDLTGDQKQAIDGICKSLRSPLPMTGLLTGDVATGKTLAFLIPMVAAHRAGKKAVLMTPNLLLIRQVTLDMEAFFPEVPLCVVLGKTGAGNVSGDPEKSIIIGTSALLGAQKKGKLGAKPDFLVVDEQHKFSVDQRDQLLDTHTNALEATATPIPRTMALATHGTKDLFILRQVPVEKRISSRVLERGVDDQAREARNAILRAILTRGEQAAVIYPIVETEDPKKALQSVTEASANWARKVPVEQIAVLHGRMSPDEKDATLDAFRRGEQRLLLASTVIEVGVTLPELKTMLVIGADAMGVVTLHQLRGRLARKGGDGDFIMMTESLEPEAHERLALLVDHQDGFLLAEKDAEKRGYGDMLGIDGDTQSGRTRTIFLGVNIGPRHISFAANLHEKMLGIENANKATEVVNEAAKRGDNLRLA